MHKLNLTNSWRMSRIRTSKRRKNAKSSAKNLFSKSIKSKLKIDKEWKSWERWNIRPNKSVKIRKVSMKCCLKIAPKRKNWKYKNNYSRCNECNMKCRSSNRKLCWRLRLKCQRVPLSSKCTQCNRWWWCSLWASLKCHSWWTQWWCSQCHLWWILQYWLKLPKR